MPQFFDLGSPSPSLDSLINNVPNNVQAEVREILSSAPGTDALTFYWVQGNSIHLKVVAELEAVFTRNGVNAAAASQILARILAEPDIFDADTQSYDWADTEKMLPYTSSNLDTEI